MSAVPLRLAGVRVERDRLNVHRRRVPLVEPEAYLSLFTQGGADRSVLLTEADLLRLITDAAAALTVLQPHRTAATHTPSA